MCFTRSSLNFFHSFETRKHSRLECSVNNDIKANPLKNVIHLLFSSKKICSYRRGFPSIFITFYLRYTTSLSVSFSIICQMSIWCWGGLQKTRSATTALSSLRTTHLLIGGLYNTEVCCQTAVVTLCYPIITQ